MMRSLPVRRLHRWVAIAFTLCVVANIVALAIGHPPAWVTYSPLAPLFFLMMSGLMMFFLPTHPVADVRSPRGSEG